MSRPQNSFWTVPRLQKKLVRAPPPKNTPKISQNQKLVLEENIEIQSYSTRWVDPKTVFEPNPAIPQGNYGLKKSETTPKSGQSQKSELKES